MPYLDTAQSWLTQSTLILQARPSTTRITTKYTILPPPSSTPSQPASTTTAASTSTKPEPPRANLTLKTYDPHSGTTLKYRTTKAAEVSRLIQILGRLARPMAGLSVLPLDMDTSVEAGNGGAAETQVGVGAGGGSGNGGAAPQQGGATAGGAGGKKNKKKGGKK